jgi:hypothetical protein
MIKQILLRKPSWLLTGESVGAGPELTLLFTGSPAMKEYLVRRFFGGTPRETSLGRRWAARVGALARRVDSRCSMSIIELTQSESAACRFVTTHLQIPVWKPVELDLRGSLEASLKKRWYKDTTRLIAQKNFSPEITTCPSSFETFYHEMYVPYVYGRHAKAAVVSPPEPLRERFSKGEIVFVKDGRRALGGMLLDFGHKEPRLLEMGVREDRGDLTREGVTDALYYFSLQRVMEKGGGRVGLGNARAFLNDGVLRHKQLMGGHLADAPYPRSGFLHLEVVRPEPVVEHVLIQNPVVARTRDGRLFATVFSTGPTDAASGPHQMIFERFGTEAIRPRLFSFRENARLNLY